MKKGDKLLLNFPAANRDPAAFNRADQVLLDRQENRHVAFGSGIHRCAGSNLARMELRVALEEWLARVPVFHLAEGPRSLWAGGQVRGPRQLKSCSVKDRACPFDLVRQRRAVGDAQSMQVRAAGNASSRSGDIVRPQPSHTE